MKYLKTAGIWAFYIGLALIFFNSEPDTQRWVITGGFLGWAAMTIKDIKDSMLLAQEKLNRIERKIRESEQQD